MLSFFVLLSKERFQYFTYFITFNIETGRQTNYKTDGFAAFLEFLEYFNEKSVQHMSPGDYL